MNELWLFHHFLYKLCCSVLLKMLFQSWIWLFCSQNLKMVFIGFTLWWTVVALVKSFKVDLTCLPSGECSSPGRMFLSFSWKGSCNHTQHPQLLSHWQFLLLVLLFCLPLLTYTVECSNPWSPCRGVPCRGRLDTWQCSFHHSCCTDKI